MTTENTLLKRPTGYDAELRSVFGPIFERIAEGNRQRENDRVLPHEQVRWLNDAGFGTLRIPAEQGGFGASLEQTFLLLAELGHRLQPIEGLLAALRPIPTSPCS